MPGAIVGYVRGRPVHVIAGGSSAEDPVTDAVETAEATAPAPTPKDVADRTAEADDEPEPTVTVTQRRMNLLLTREKDQGRQAVLRALAAEVGLDPATVDTGQLKRVLADAQQIRDAQLSDEQRRAAEFDRREKVLAAREAAAEQAVADATARLQKASRSAELLALGATGQDLDDALVLLDKALEGDADPDAAAIAAAATVLKERRPALFGTAVPAPRTATPPAPSGAPATAPPTRPAPSGRPGDAGRAMASRMFPAASDSAA
ncbi:hypothetical protein [Streptomyces sp. NPDC001404]|uniref:hypothetical protein n=1 Tax=Streptomyces sp. NPDC001404 TaxID=3364571 RepID=UPI00368E1009